MEISEPCGYNTLVMFNEIRVNCWLPYSLPALSPKPLCQAPYHATLCCLHLADGLSRQCMGMSPRSLSPCRQSGSRWWGRAGLLPCPPPPCSAAHGNIPMTPSSSFSPLAAGRCDWWGVSECSRSLPRVGGWSFAFPCYGTVIPNHRAAARGGKPGPHHEHWRGDSPPKSTVDMGINFCSEKKGEKSSLTVSFSATVPKSKTS